ncbi:MAG: SUF system Fe-S cluster assembly regulator [Pseudomonadota bacterium]
MIKISKMADYAVVVLEVLARPHNDPISASYIAEQTKLPDPTVSKVLKLLARRNIIASVRGPSGGYILPSQPETISIASIIEATDGPIAITDCVSSAGNCCERSSICSIHGRWDKVNAALVQAMENMSLKQVMKNYE